MILEYTPKDEMEQSEKGPEQIKDVISIILVYNNAILVNIDNNYMVTQVISIHVLSYLFSIYWRAF